MLASLASAQGSPSLTSDLPYYVPGTTAELTGSGFAPDETVSLLVARLEGPQSTAAGHAPWSVTADAGGGFVTTWPVCEDCVGLVLVASADGDASGSHGQTSFSQTHECGDGVVTSVTPVGGSCTAFTPAVGNGPDNYEVVEGGTYVMTIEGVTECSGDTITVFVQSSGSGNFCFNATGGGGTYSGTFTVPDPACHTMPVSYKCGANAACSHPDSYGAQGPTSGCGGVHLRASTFDGSCVKTGHDTDCDGGCTPCALECPQDASVGCTESTDPASTGTPTGCEDATFVDSIAPGACDGSYVITRVWSAPDGCPGEGTATCEQTITVTDDQGPTISCPENVSVDCSDSTDPAATGSATAEDDCSGADITPSDSIAPGDCDGSYVITRTWTATDGCGNQSSCEQTITVTDTTPPEITCPPDVTLTGCCVTGGIGEATAIDDCSNATVTSDAPAEFCVGETIVTWTATDDCGNASTCEQVVTVVDVTLDFQSDVSLGLLLHGQSLVTPGPETAFSCPSISSGPDPASPGNGNNGAAVFDSTNGPFGQDPDLGVGLGNVLYCQRNGGATDDFTGVNGPDTWDHPNDDEDGGTLTFDFCGGVKALSIDLIDIDDPSPAQSTLVILTDVNLLTRTYTVPGGWTADGPGAAAVGMLLLDAEGLQPGFNADATESTQAGYDETSVVKIEVQLGSSGAVDNLRYCPPAPQASVTPRNGSGSNPDVLAAETLPVLGTTWTATLDCRAYGDGIAILAVRREPLPGTMSLQGEVLIAGELMHHSARPYSQATQSASVLTWEIPDDISLAGLELYVQGLCQVTSSSPAAPKAFRVKKQLTNALDLVLGF